MATLGKKKEKSNKQTDILERNTVCLVQILQYYDAKAIIKYFINKVQIYF